MIKEQIKTLAELANHFNADYTGDPKVSFESVSPITHSSQTCITAIFSSKYLDYFKTAPASIIIVDRQFEPTCSRNTLIVSNPRLVLAKITQWLHPKTVKASVHSSAVIGQDCMIDPSVYIGPNVVIGDRTRIERDSQIHAGVVVANDCRIGERVSLEYGVKCYDKTIIGHDCSIQANTVIGSDGFGYVFNEQDLSWFKVPQVGSIIIVLILVRILVLIVQHLGKPLSVMG